MYITNVLHSKLTAIEVVSILEHFVRNEISEQHFKLEIINSAGEESFTWLRPILEQDFILSADRSQLVKCISRDGERIDILIPPPGNRQNNPAGIIIEQAA